VFLFEGYVNIIRRMGELLCVDLESIEAYARHWRRHIREEGRPIPEAAYWSSD
jgi:hypothetical protein